MPENSYQSPLGKVSLISGGKKWAISCYIPIFNVVTCILTSVRMVNDKFCIFHARQGLLLFALWFLTILVALILPIVSLMLWGVVLFLHIVGLVIAATGKETPLPIIGQLAMKIPPDYISDFLTGKKNDLPPSDEHEHTA